MKYTINNYEEFALDYLEGNLDAEDRQEFEAFLILNPEIKESFDEFSLVTLPSFTPVLPDKSALYKKEPIGKMFPIYLRAIAAAVLVLILFVFLINYKNDETNNQMANNHPEYQPAVETPAQQEKVENTEKEKKESLASAPEAETQSARIKTVEKPIKKLNISPTPAQNKESDIEELAMNFSIEPENQKQTILIQPIVLIEKINIIPTTQFNYQIEHRPTYLIVEEEKREDTISKISKLLAKANLIPDGLREEIEDIDLKEKMIPESYVDLK